MRHVNSADGTAIALDEKGTGTAVIVVNGALSTARDGAAFADDLAAAGFRAVTYDRRARGDSGDTPPSSPAREVDDLVAVIEAAGGDAVVVGHSSGAVLALHTAASDLAARGVQIRHLFLSEPPFHFGTDDVPVDLADRLQALIDAGHGEDAVVLFQREAIGLPEEMIAQFRTTPAFAQIVPLAQSTVYDTTLTSALSTPTDAMLSVQIPVTILCGAQTFAFLSAAAERLAAAMPQAELIVMPESVGHRLDGAAATRIVTERCG
ncbi:alpha/beta hydrolase [Microbacterium sp. VKM Ac-2870]|uniref:alpha/beta fold hydrolase n=1 Tax=Microbacterium sp. VKM Ac-2870 TaxID=2783825 RepID=UPI00188A1DB1|nr:alpha/beta hydrolase [Microbacterium sp. VKM Ac-2870]MBF4562125.1 alpha/beta hydrolase [Microbacterium sp. VKM Ac-2870]